MKEYISIFRYLKIQIYFVIKKKPETSYVTKYTQEVFIDKLRMKVYIKVVNKK